MDYETAKTELLRHAGITDDFYPHGFLASLRPYTGLRSENFHMVVEAIFSVGHALSTSGTVDRSIIYAVWSIIARARVLGIEDHSLLVRNRLITSQDHEVLKRWVDVMERTMLQLLHGQTPSQAIHGYCEYVAEYGWGPNLVFFLPILGQAMEADEHGYELESHCQAIARAGTKAVELKEILLRAKHRRYRWYEPHERCQAEMLVLIDQALASIDGGNEIL